MIKNSKIIIFLLSISHSSWVLSCDLIHGGGCNLVKDLQEATQKISKNLEQAGKEIEKGVSNLGDAVSDVVTLGGAGRKRDIDRAEADKRVKDAQREGVEKLREHEIISIKEQIALLKQVDNYFSDAQELINKMWTYYDNILQLGVKELKNREASSKLIDWLADSTRKSDIDIKSLSNTLFFMQSVNDKLLDTLSKKRNNDLQSEAQQSTKKYIESAAKQLRTASTQLETSNLYLSELNKLKNEVLLSLIKDVINVRSLTGDLRTRLEKQREDFKLQLEVQEKKLRELETISYRAIISFYNMS